MGADAPSIYGDLRPTLEKVMQGFVSQIRNVGARYMQDTGESTYEHLASRIKSESSMREKCQRKGLPETPHTALRLLNDAIGMRIVCRFLNDVYENVRLIKSLPCCRVVEEKDYIRHVKPRGYRSYHMILEITAPYKDIDGHMPGHFLAEVQLRTIAQDSWASLEHQLQYKHDLKDPEMIRRELKRCADELAACDVSMQTIRDLIRDEH